MIRIGGTSTTTTWKCEACGTPVATALPTEPVCSCGWLANVPAFRFEVGKGVGTELKKIFSSFGFQPCESCLVRANALDEYGVAWCEEHIHVVVQWISEAAHDRWLPAVGVPAIVQMAIDRAKGR